MRKILLIFSFLLLTFISSGCTLPFNRQAYSLLQVASIPKATVYVDDKEVGKTPYVDEKITPGEHDIRLSSDQPTLVSWQAKVKFTAKIVTVINRILGQTEILSSGEIITLEPTGDNKSAEIAVISDPDAARVLLDKTDVGLTPFAQKNTTLGDHELTISLAGYTQKTLKVKTVAGYRTRMNIQLAQILTPQGLLEATGSATISGQTDGGEVKVTPTKSLQPERPRVKIVNDQEGWANVRSAPNFSGSKITKVYHGEYYPYLDEQGGWVKIKLDKEKEGWVSVQYVEKQL